MANRTFQVRGMSEADRQLHQCIRDLIHRLSAGDPAAQALIQQLQQVVGPGVNLNVPAPVPAAQAEAEADRLIARFQAEPSDSDQARRELEALLENLQAPPRPVLPVHGAAPSILDEPVPQGLNPAAPEFVPVQQGGSGPVQQPPGGSQPAPGSGPSGMTEGASVGEQQVGVRVSEFLDHMLNVS